MVSLSKERIPSASFGSSMDDLKRPSVRRVAKQSSKPEAIALATTTVAARQGTALLQAQSRTVTALREIAQPEIVQRVAVLPATVLVDVSKANLANIIANVRRTMATRHLQNIHCIGVALNTTIIILRTGTEPVLTTASHRHRWSINRPTPHSLAIGISMFRSGNRCQIDSLLAQFLLNGTQPIPLSPPRGSATGMAQRGTREASSVDTRGIRMVPTVPRIPVLLA